MKNLGIGLELLVLGMGTVVLSLYILYLFLKLSGRFFSGRNLENLALLNKESFGLKKDKNGLKKNHKTDKEADQVKKSQKTEKVKKDRKDREDQKSKIKDKIENAEESKADQKLSAQQSEEEAGDNNDRDKINQKKDLIESINEVNEEIKDTNSDIKDTNADNKDINIDNKDINTENKAKIQDYERVEKEDRVNMEGASMEAETKAIDRKKVAAITAVLKENYFSESKKHFRIISIKRRNNQWKR